MEPMTLNRLEAAFSDVWFVAPCVGRVDITERNFARIESTANGLRVFLTRKPQKDEDEDTVPMLELGDRLTVDDAIRLICTAVSVLD